MQQLHPQAVGQQHLGGQPFIAAPILKEKDVVQNILSLIKSNAHEYATAVTEASCPVLRQTLQRLLNETLAEQADCFQIMQRHGFYAQVPAAPKQDIVKSIQQSRQALQEVSQVLQGTGIHPSAISRPGVTPYNAGVYSAPMQQHLQNPNIQPYQANYQTSHFAQVPSQQYGVQSVYQTANPELQRQAQQQDPNFWRTQTATRQHAEITH